MASESLAPSYSVKELHLVVRDALAAACVGFGVVHPLDESKGEYLERYRKRGSSENFLQLLDLNWASWVRGMVSERRASRHVVLRGGEFISRSALQDV